MSSICYGDDKSTCLWSERAHPLVLIQAQNDHRERVSLMPCDKSAEADARLFVCSDKFVYVLTEWLMNDSTNLPE